MKRVIVIDERLNNHRLEGRWLCFRGLKVHKDRLIPVNLFNVKMIIRVFLKVIF